MSRDSGATNALFVKKDADEKSLTRDDFEKIPLSMLPKEFADSDAAKFQYKEITSQVDGSILRFVARGTPQELETKIKELVKK
jgi:hypothetical protein